MNRAIDIFTLENLTVACDNMSADTLHLHAMKMFKRPLCVIQYGHLH
jgi:hypothetical protein